MDIFKAVKTGDVTSLTKKVLSSGYDMKQVDKNGCSLLFVASFYNRLHIVKYSLSLRVNTEVTDNQLGWTALHVAASKDHTDIVKELLNHNAKVDAKSKSGQTPLWTAAYQGHRDLLGLLANRGADVNLCKLDGASPLFAATQQNCIRSAQLLLKEGAKVNQCMKDGASPLYMAAQKGQLQMVQILLDAEANCELCYKTGATALIVACGNRHVPVVRLLLQHGANSNAVKVDGSTALHRAVEERNTDIVKLLLKYGAKVCKNNSNKTPLDIAKGKGYKGIVAILEPSYGESRKSGVTYIGVLEDRNPRKKEMSGKSYIGEIKANKYKTDLGRHAETEDIGVLEEKDEDAVHARPELENEEKVETVQIKKELGNILQGETTLNKEVVLRERGTVDQGGLKLGQSSVREEGFSKIVGATVGINYGDARNRNTKEETGQEVDPDEIRKKLRLLKLTETLEEKIRGADDPLLALFERIHKVKVDADKSTGGKDQFKDLSNRHLMRIAQQLGGKWKQLGAYLGLNFTDIECLQKDNPEDTLYAAWAMLVMWRDSDKVGLDEKKEMLKQAIGDLNRTDLQDIV